MNKEEYMELYGIDEFEIEEEFRDYFEERGFYPWECI